MKAKRKGTEALIVRKSKAEQDYREYKALSKVVEKAYARQAVLRLSLENSEWRKDDRFAASVQYANYRRRSFFRVVFVHLQPDDQQKRMVPRVYAVRTNLAGAMIGPRKLVHFGSLLDLRRIP